MNRQAGYHQTFRWNVIGLLRFSTNQASLWDEESKFVPWERLVGRMKNANFNVPSERLVILMMGYYSTTAASHHHVLCAGIVVKVNSLYYMLQFCLADLKKCIELHTFNSLNDGFTGAGYV